MRKTKKAKNILFIMYDQLRFDYLSCTGHPHLKTPNMDYLASQGVRFNRCYVQSPICGASRMSFYTGRYVNSHGAAWNNFPLKVGELTLGDHLRDHGMDAWLIGKTHMAADSEGMARLGLKGDNIIGARIEECGFDIFIRDDGLWGEGPKGFYDKKRSPYNEYLKSKGYQANNPWHDYANSSIDEKGDVASGWFMSHASKAANIKNEDSETPWLTSKAIEFLKAKKSDEKPWLCHLSYIKPHWPYIVPAPYHNIYDKSQILPAVKSEDERNNAHPVFDQYMNSTIGKSFSREEVRDAVVPTYMALIKQCDDELGRLLEYLKTSGEMENTMIVITSDHGDYLGDHWMGEKDLFHDPSVKVPLIIYDPSSAGDGTRGSICDELVEAIDLAASFIDFAGGNGDNGGNQGDEADGSNVPDHIVEGRSLMPFIYGQTVEDWREYAVSEYDFSATEMAENLGLKPRDARLFMIADKDWKFMHSEGGHRPMLFDLNADPNELNDLGRYDAHHHILDLMYARLGKWARRMSQRTTITDEKIIASRGKSSQAGILIGVYDEHEVDEKYITKYKNKTPKNYIKPKNHS